MDYRFGIDVLTGQVGDPEPYVLVPVDQALTLFLAEEDPTRLIGFELVEFLSGFHRMDWDHYERVLGADLVHQLRAASRTLTSSKTMEPKVQRRALPTPLADPMVRKVGHLTDEDIYVRASRAALLRTAGSTTEDALIRESRIRSPAPIPNAKPWTRLSRRAREALGQLAEVLIPFERIALASVRGGPPQTSQTQTFESVDHRFHVSAGWDSGTLFAVGSVPVSLQHLKVRLRLQLSPSIADALEPGIGVAVSGTSAVIETAVDEHGRFRAAIGETETPPSSRDPIVELFELMID
jgi:hypothetical protein